MKKWMGILLCALLAGGNPGWAKTVRKKKIKWKEGVEKKYYASGEVMSENSYLKGSLDGTSFDYYKSGQTMYAWNYRSNKLHGVSRAFYGDGNLMARWKYKRGVLHGKSYEYHRKGKMKTYALYKKGALARKKNFNLKGKLVSKEGYPPKRRFWSYFKLSRPAPK